MPSVITTFGFFHFTLSLNTKLTPIQGSAADIMKKAMIDLAQRLKGSRLEARLILQVHDELMLECPPAELEDTRRLVQETMENAVSISIPLTTEARSGPNWGALEALGN